MAIGSMTTNSTVDMIDKTLKTENAPADAAATGAAIAKCKADTLLAAYPAGSLYMSAKATSPASLFGGTWEQIKDRFILAAGDTYAAGSTGGEAEHALTVDEMPAHRHEGINIDNIYCFGWENGSRTGVNFKKFYGGTYWGDDVQNRLASGYAGGSTAHNNMPPYLTAYIWKRIV